jgi:acetoin:2,6-dichlorophenolindophenol oxidoreductase subunit alpha
LAAPLPNNPAGNAPTQWMYWQMLRLRRFEETVAALFAEGKLPGFIHAAVGQEAVPVGVCAHLRQDDYITSTHRADADFLAKGGSMNGLMAELFGKAGGCCRGKGGSMHVAEFAQGIIGANGIVGAGLPIANGLALAAQMQGAGQVTVAFFGDGATNQGAFHEAINLAAVWNLPIVFVCSNNLYGQSTPQSVHQKIKDIALRADSYGIPGITIDGNDAMDVFHVAGEMLHRARSGGGPSIVECKTYRWLGHYVGDSAEYRPDDELEIWKARDPISNLRTRMLFNQEVTEGDLEEVEMRVQQEVAEAVRFAQESPAPPAEWAYEDVFSGGQP